MVKLAKALFCFPKKNHLLVLYISLLLWKKTADRLSMPIIHLYSVQIICGIVNQLI